MSLPWALAIALLATGLLPAGCNRPKQRYKPAALATQSDVSRYVLLALEHDDADVRRSAIQQIARTRHAGLPVALDAFALAARTDPSESVRCAAIRALGEHQGDKTVNTMIVLLTTTEEPSGVRPAGAGVRWEASRVLCNAVRSDAIGESSRRVVRAVAVDRLERDASRDVRLTAAKLLGYDPDLVCVRALIGSLRQRDFGVVYEAERSLMRLTGKSHEHDAARWSRWLDATADPFAQRGALDAKLDSDSRRGLWPFRKRS